ncbi:acyltransferase [Actinoplanes sp. NPDC051861]|uniref:acyltransferase family protein n=1 Tax=Actinoplanes sp. NPDC051861 TaxID=3155170 RepID=UPI00341F7A7D
MSVTESDRRVGAGSDRDHKRIPVVDGVRGLCALALLITHVAMVSGLLGTRETGAEVGPSHYLGGFFAGGLQIAAGVFFTLSGLYVYRPFAKSVITGGPKPSGRHNFARRALRLLPAYYLMYVVVLLALNLESIDSVWYVVRPLLLLHIYDFVWMDGMEVSWTVPAMAQFYLLLPLLAWATRRWAGRGATMRQRAYRLMLPVPFLIASGFAWLFFVKANDLGTRALFWWPMGLLPEIGIGMALGILLALTQASPSDTPKLFRAAAARPNLFLLSALVIVLVNCARPFAKIGMDDIYTVSGLVFFYVILGLFSIAIVTPLVAPGASSRVRDGLLGNAPMVYLGRISYGVYLWHFAVMHFYLQPDTLFGGDSQMILGLYREAGFWELQLVTLTGAVLLATISYYLMERPLMNWGERRLRRRDEARAAVGGRPR